ncbi:hypothetical protein QYF36_009235 [Acer negundo]|nr:hypothetical protein QYF36_009235 [Acer negundo]
MTVCYPSTPKKLAMTVGCFIVGAALFAVGVHISYLNIAPQQARIKARNDFVKDRAELSSVLLTAWPSWYFSFNFLCVLLYFSFWFQVLLAISLHD